MSPLNAIPGLCPMCGGTQLEPTRGGVPRGTCHCEVRVQLINYVAATEKGNVDAEAYQVGPGLAVGRRLIWVEGRRENSEDWRIVHMTSGFAFGAFPTCKQAVSCARELLQLRDGASGHVVDWTQLRDVLVAKPGLRPFVEERILTHGGLLR